MPQFHETGYGSRFYNGQLPSLIDALKRIAMALEKIADPPKLDKEKVRIAIFEHLLLIHGLTEDDAREDTDEIINVVFKTLQGEKNDGC